MLRRARAIAERYRMTLERGANVGYVGSAVEMPYVMADGRTAHACAHATTEALVTAVATLLEQGERPPAPVRDARRSAQINLRVTSEEKLALEHAARRGGFRSVSDYLRARALASR